MMIYKNKKGDLCLELNLCSFVLNILSREAKANHRSIEAEITHRLRATLYNDIEYRVRVNELLTAKIKTGFAKKQPFALSTDMLDLLLGSASRDDHSLDEEVLLRLLVSFVNPAEMELVNHCNALIRQRITNEALEREKIVAMAAAYRGEVLGPPQLTGELADGRGQRGRGLGRARRSEPALAAPLRSRPRGHAG